VTRKSFIKVSEKLIENFVRDYPLEFLGEQLQLVKQQPRINGHIPDLLFLDKNGTYVVVELQLGELDRIHLYKSLEYRDAYMTDKSTPRIILVSEGLQKKQGDAVSIHKLEHISLEMDEFVNKVMAIDPSFEFPIAASDEVEDDENSDVVYDEIISSLKEESESPLEDVLYNVVKAECMALSGMSVDRAKSDSDSRFLSSEEVIGLIKKAEDLYVIGKRRKSNTKIRDSFIIQTVLLTGLTTSEVCNLRITDLRINGKQSCIVVRKGKAGKKRLVHIGLEYRRMVKRYLQWKHQAGECRPDAYLLKTERSEKYSPCALWRRWREYCSKGLYSARHTNANALLQASGGDIKTLQAHLGHSRTNTTKKYTDFMLDRIVGVA